MKHIAYLPIYNWGKNPDLDHGTTFGTHIYLDLEELYAYEDPVGHVQIEIHTPTENEFKELHGLKSGAV
jgi:hypothetical protein